MRHSGVVIAGTGIAAAASAIWLAEFGFEALLLDTARPLPDGVEAIPEAALSTLPDGIAQRALERAAAVVVEGFEDVTEGVPGPIRSGRYLHVNRRHLRFAMLAEALRKGARVEHLRTLPTTTDVPDGVVLSDRPVEFLAAIDATGRSARWIGPTERRGAQVAVMYRTPGSTGQRGRVARFDGGWAYSLSTCWHGTAAVVTPRGVRVLDAELAARLGVDGPLWPVGRRPAFVQWARTPVRGHLLAVGDAALAYDPISGHGARFALSSAHSACSVVSTLYRQPHNTAAAQAFHAEFVASARDRHLAHLETPSVTLSRRPLPLAVQFCGTSAVRGLQVNGLIEPGEAVLLPDGGQARWIGGFDLLWLRTWAERPVPTVQVVEAVATAGLSRELAWALVRWCLDRGVLSDAGR